MGFAVLSIALLVFFILWLVLRVRNRKLRAQIDAGNRAYARLQGKVQELERQLRESKLDSLQGMLNPHSFKNTLVTIKSLAKQTVQSVESLGGILDYMLYDAQQRYVPLRKEVKFAHEYIQLFRFRLKAHVKVQVDLSIDEDEFDEKYQIPPMIFANFIENAFKHGDLESEDAFININLDLLDSNEIVYSVRNRISRANEREKGGLGYAKLKERLDLLYGRHYALDHSSNGEIYTANLKLRLHEKQA